MESIKVNRKIELNKVFKISRMKEVIKPTKPHKHDGYYEIIYLTDGAGVHIIDDNHFQVETPMLFFMNPGHVHCWEFTKIPKGYVCLFKEELLTNNPYIKLIINRLSLMYLLSKSTEKFDDLFRMIHEEYELQHPDLSILESFLDIILMKISRLPISDTNMRTISPLVASFRSLVDSHFLTQKNIGYYASLLHVNARALTNACKREVGRPALSLINERIIDESKRLLKHTTNSISEIAYHLQFNDPSHFVKFFKSKTNLTPGEYREMV
jgi:AraC family transcriptional regulator, transcriptional activator of pobA